MVSLCLPVVTNMYRRLMRRLRHWVLGPQPEGLPLRRIELALNDGGPALNIRIAANLDQRDEADDADERQQGDGQERQNDEAAPVGRRQQAQHNNEDPAAIAEQTVRVTGTSLGRFVGGALMVPKISSWMGTVLFNLSRHSTLLRKFLGVRPPLRFRPDVTGTVFGSYGEQRHGFLQQLRTNFRVMLNILFSGTKVWADADPVW
jgi:hypothetical protein